MFDPRGKGRSYLDGQLRAKDLQNKDQQLTPLVGLRWILRPFLEHLPNRQYGRLEAL